LNATRTGSHSQSRSAGATSSPTRSSTITRAAYVELLGDERAATVTAFTERALNWLAARGIRAKRVMTDNAWSYTHNNSLRELFDAKDIRHVTIRPHRPQTNGKVERFHQTMLVSGPTASPTTHTATAIEPCHTGRVHNLCGQDI